MEVVSKRGVCFWNVKSFKLCLNKRFCTYNLSSKPTVNTNHCLELLFFSIIKIFTSACILDFTC